MKKSVLFFLALCSAPVVLLSQITTSSAEGRVTDEKGNAIEMASIVMKHEPTGTVYITESRTDGRYSFDNIRVGGPYTMKTTAMGFKEKTIANATLQLGRRGTFNFILSEDQVMLEEAVVTFNSAINNNRKGSETMVSEVALNNLPTISRDLSDFSRLTPQANVQGRGGQTEISIAGMNNRYNSVFIDGAVNNDVFGLASTGTNGGQTGGQPISLDAIEELQVVVAPYDVKLSGFAGGGINAVTRSGSNIVEGSVYTLQRNQALSGKTPTDIEGAERTKLNDFTSQIYGFRVGAPIIKDKLFLFVNGEIKRDNTPQPVPKFDDNALPGGYTRQEIESFRDKLLSYGYDPGTWDKDVSNELSSNMFLIKLDYNINNKNTLTLRHSYTRHESLSFGRSTNNTINFSNSGIFFPSTTNSSALELNTRVANNMSNNLIVGFTRVNDDRGAIGDPFPYVSIRGNLNAGSEQFSTGNLLTQSILTLTDNFDLYKGKHHFTFGTHNEFYDMNNVFIRQAYGSYRFDSVSQFVVPANPIPTQYDISYSLNPNDDNVNPDKSTAAAAFKALQLGFYAQDEYKVNEKFRVTGGLRIDIPMFLSKPENDGYFNDTAIATIESFGYDLRGARAGQAPKAQLLFSPRVGFNYDIKGDQTFILRGGAGLFTSRIPFVWPGGMYNNNGATVGGLRRSYANFQSNNLSFRPDPFNQFRASDFGLSNRIPQGEMNVFAEDFRFPQIIRTNIAVDKTIFWGMIFTADVIYSKTINNIFYENLSIKPSTENLTGTPDDRPYFNRFELIEPKYTGIYLGSNTNQGYSLNASLQLLKHFEKGLAFVAAYNYGMARSVYDGTSSQNSSQWRGVNSIEGRNIMPLGISDFDMGHRAFVSGSYTLNYAQNKLATTFGFFLNGQSGMVFSYIYDDSGNLNNEDSRARNLIYVPRDASEIKLVSYTQGGTTFSPEEQWQRLNAFISNDRHLDSRRGDYAERNGARTPFETVLDLRIAQDIVVFKAANGRENKFQITLDIFNFTNLLNPNWGRRYFVSEGQYALIRFEGFETSTRTPTFTFRERAEKFDILDRGVYSSRWQGQIGLRYTF